MLRMDLYIRMPKENGYSYVYINFEKDCLGVGGAWGRGERLCFLVGCVLGGIWRGEVIENGDDCRWDILAGLRHDINKQISAKH